MSISRRLSFLSAALIAVAAISLVGCGGGGAMSQEELKRRAIKRAPDVEAPPPETKAVAKVDDAKAGKRSSPAKTGPRAGKTATAAGGKATDAPPATNTSAVVEKSDSTPAESPSNSVSIAGSDTQSPPATPLTAEARARRTVANLDRIGAAFQKYVQEKTVFPSRAIFDGNKAPILSWRVALLPYLGYQDLYEQFRLNEPWDSRHNQALLAKIPSVYQSPERFDERTNYLVPVSTNTTFGKDVIAWPSTIEDGPRNTVFVLEADEELAVPWTEPRDYDLKIAQPVAQLGSLRGGSLYVVWGSGEVGRILTSAPLKDLKAMFTYDGGEDFSAAKIKQPLFAFTAAVDASSPSANGPSNPSTVGSALIAAPVSESLATFATIYQDRIGDAAALGHEREASQWFYAAALVSPPGSTWVERYQWVPALKRPVPLLRIGVGLKYTGPRRSELEQASALKSGRITAASTSWTKVTGEIGKSILASLSRHIEADVEKSLLAPPIDSRPGRRGQFVRTTRPVTPKTPALLRTSPGESLAQGVHFIAIADEPVLRTAARREGVEVLALVEWKDLGHKQSVRMELIDTARDVTILQLPWIDSTEVADSMTNPLGKNPFPDFLRQLDEFLEQQLTFQPFPEQIQPRHVAGRINQLATSKSDNPLAALAEMRYYRERNLADDTQLLLAFQTLIGQKPGSELILGDGPTRERVLKTWLPAPPPPASVPRTAIIDD